MSIQLRCPHCSTTLRVADTVRGKRIRCNKCEGVVPVDDNIVRSNGADKEGITSSSPRSKAGPSRSKDDTPPPKRRRQEEDEDDRPRRRARAENEDDDDQPSRRRRNDDDDDDRRPRRKRRRDDDKEEARGLPLPLIIGGAVGGGVLLIGAVVLVILLSRGGANPQPQPIAQNGGPNDQPPIVNPPPQNNVPNNQPANNNVPANNNQPPNEQPKNKQPKNQQPPNNQPNNNVPPDNQPVPKPPRKNPPKVEPPQPPPAPVVWNVQPDPLPKPVAEPANPQAQMPVPPGAKILFPRGPSQFVALGGNEGWQIFDLAKLQKSGEIPGRVQLDEVSLSPDGKYLAGKVSGFGPTRAEVRSCANGQPLRQVVLHDQFKSVHLVDFAGPDQLVTVIPGDGFGKNEWKVWDIATGNEVRKFADGGNNLDGKSVAFSPGRRYVAVPQSDHKIFVVDMSTGQQAGILQFPAKEGFGTWRCEGLAFSHDGNELAGVFTMLDKSRIVSWKTADGNVAADHAFPTNLPRSIKGLGLYQAPALEPISDGSGWLAYGHLLIDRASGGVILSMPAAPGLSTQRRLIGKYHLATLAGDFANKQFTIQPLPKDQIAAGLAAAKLEADPNAGKLPDVTAADWSMTQQLPPLAGATPWTVQADPATPVKAMATRPIPLRVPGGDIGDIVFSAPEAGLVAVVSAAARNPAGKKTFISVDRYELLSGKHLGTQELFAVDNFKDRTVPAQLSPDGSLLALKEPTGGKRIDVWSLKDNKHLVGWLPFERENDNQIRTAAWIDNEHLLTQGMTGRLVLWKVPECKALYSTTNQGIDLALSPGRKYAAIFNGATLDILETLTGKRCGQLAPPPAAVSAVNAVAFSSDGKKLAAFVQPGSLLARWNLAGGELEGADNVNQSFLSELRWCSPTHLLAGSSLIDVNLKGVLWQYMMPPGQGKYAAASPDGRLWFAASANPSAPALLAAQTVPDQQALAMSAQIAGGQVVTLFGPGKRVRVQVNGGDADFQAKVTQALGDGLRAMKAEAAPDGDLTLTVQVEERNTGKTLELESFGIGKKRWSIPIMEVETRAALTDNAGRTLWERKTKNSTPSSIGLVRTDDPAQYFRDQLWNGVRGFASSARPPGHIIEVGGQPRTLPMTSMLGS